MDQQTVVQPDNRIRFSDEKERTMKETSLQRIYIVWFHFFSILEKTIETNNR